MHVRKTGQQRGHVRGERIAGQRAASRGVFVAAAVGQRSHDGLRVMVVPGSEVAVEGVRQGHHGLPGILPTSDMTTAAGWNRMTARSPDPGLVSFSMTRTSAMT